MVLPAEEVVECIRNQPLPASIVMTVKSKAC